jgi:hypothetical protein
VTGDQPIVSVDDHLDRHETIALATRGPDRLPHAATLRYRRESGDLSIAVTPASPTARNLGVVGTVTGTVDGQDATGDHLSLQLRGSAELSAATIPASGSQASGVRCVYRIVADEV